MDGFFSCEKRVKLSVGVLRPGRVVDSSYGGRQCKFFCKDKARVSCNDGE